MKACPKDKEKRVLTGLYSGYIMQKPIMSPRPGPHLAPRRTRLLQRNERLHVVDPLLRKHLFREALSAFAGTLPHRHRLLGIQIKCLGKGCRVLFRCGSMESCVRISTTFSRPGSMPRCRDKTIPVGPPSTSTTISLLGPPLSLTTLINPAA